MAQKQSVAGDMLVFRGFSSRFTGQPELAFRDAAVASAASRLKPIIQGGSHPDLFLLDMISKFASTPKIQVGFHAVARMTLHRSGLGHRLFELTGGQSKDLLAAANLLVLAIRRLIRRERAGQLPEMSHREL
ncbi:hypothetical protein GGE65_006237 [Skermanella aerolata]|uniref:hypothetical protein n=1 Tax=Skermanella aerolata TaxID=393310 RepID=UPI003D1CF67B